MNKCLSILVAAFSALSVPVHCQTDGEDPLVTDRPDFTESAEAVAVKRVQLEFGWTFERSGDVETHTVGELLARVGVRENVELRVGVNSYVDVTAPGGDLSGPEEAFLGVKVKLVEGEETCGFGIPHVAVLAGASLPIGSDDISADGSEPEAVLALAWDLSERYSLGSNLGVANLNGETDRFTRLQGSLALGIGLTDRLGTFVEYFGFSSMEKDGPGASFIDGGFTYLVNDDFQLDLRAGLGLNDPEPEYFVGAGASLRL